MKFNNKAFLLLLAIVFAKFTLMGCDKIQIEASNKAISYNVRLGTGDDGVNKWRNRKAASIRMIEQEKPLVLGLQEALYDQIKYFDAKLPDYERVGVGRDDGKQEGEFMAVYYNKHQCKLLDAGTFWLSETPTKVSRGWDAACHRTLTWLKLEHKASKKVFYVFNTHLDHQGQVARKQSIILIDSLINAVVPEATPVVLMGDFNMLATDERLAIVFSNFDESRNCSAITDNRGTYNAFKPDFNANIIDFIFSKNLECKVHRTLDGDYGVPFISDHYPVAFEFEFFE